MEYLKHAKAVIENGKALDLMSSIVKWETVGQVVCGELQDVQDFTGGKGAHPCKRYTLDTEDGRISCILGQVVDSSLSGLNLVGHTLYIEYQGKKKTSTGNEMNVFLVKDVSDF